MERRIVRTNFGQLAEVDMGTVGLIGGLTVASLAIDALLLAGSYKLFQSGHKAVALAPLAILVGRRFI